ncbi:unnamed protein product [Cylindrotheca closterium]|uniref:Uncharacterized protein n=1 Tax=Cylindrotheca closterium TaxID=2856 RepID=A0AAD2GA32_9STRA|nr:unnamed protein product [Cylindrotheca closterium]CAJ1965593.1 unnamed protein product [Cylindrotheca closterium]
MPKVYKPNKAFMRLRTAIIYNKRPRHVFLMMLLTILLVLLYSFKRNGSSLLSILLFQPRTPPTRAPTLSPTTAESFIEGSSPYTPGQLEEAMMKVSTTREDFRYDVQFIDECDLFLNPNRTDFYQPYHDVVESLDQYAEAVKGFHTSVHDLREVPPEEQEALCGSMNDLLWKQDGDDGGDTIFQTNALSLTRGGYVEQLLPPLRHPKFCEDPFSLDHLLEIDYLVHDFGAICRHLTKHPKARTVFFDLGASLEFHGGVDNPALTLLELYQQFGVTFDHYYAFEYTPLPPAQVFEKIPEFLLDSYHWFNIPVDAEPSKKNNPWTSLLSRFHEDDFVVIKLDIDTPQVEIPLIHQLLQEKYSTVVDQLYFEHHVRMKHLYRQWQRTAWGTLQDSLDLFTRLRKTGIAAHSWV